MNVPTTDFIAISLWHTSAENVAILNGKEVKRLNPIINKIRESTSKKCCGIVSLAMAITLFTIVAILGFTRWGIASDRNFNVTMGITFTAGGFLICGFILLILALDREAKQYSTH